MTTTVVAEGKVRLKRNRGEAAPDGWLLDAAGTPTNDPRVLYEEPRGSIQPLGGVTAGHKGYGLNVAIELLAGALTGNGCIGREGSQLSNGVLLLALEHHRVRHPRRVPRRGGPLHRLRQVFAAGRGLRRRADAG